MCDFTQREYSCGHLRWLASKHCSEFKVKRKRCPPNITDFEERPNDICGECKPKKHPEGMIAFVNKMESKRRVCQL
ncbi:hypothetical protein B0T19DRAFT_74598 [Cercophora scortea]|uniref:Uncharacterized protein n=1 Tax=Cercophora scortea TaxID=314031 RepID=A0AAE0MMD4_9PEZI|nr:hypothetical protein B0T19DRAFT_74598 [Cercophora scortea]